MVLVPLPEADVELLMQRSLGNPQHSITINLEAQTITDDQGYSSTFEIDPFRAPICASMTSSCRRNPGSP